MKKLIIICFLILTSISSFSQNSNFKAQGNYYSAKSNFEKGDYTQALIYVNKCKTELGGTNYQLQYLHILTANRLYKYEEAAKELQVYFDIADKKIKPVTFDKSVDELTNDETKALTMLIDPILESAAKKKNNPCSLCKGSGFTTPCDYCEGDGYLKSDCSHYSCDNGKIDCNCYICNGAEEGNGGCFDGVHSWNSGHWTSGTQVRKVSCKTCAGKGKVDCKKCDGLGYSKKSCSHCDNKGSIPTTTASSNKETCSKCHGVGF